MTRSFCCGAGKIMFCEGVGLTVLDWEDEGHGCCSCATQSPRDALKVLSTAPPGAERVKTAQSDRVQSPRAILQYSFLWDHSWACWDGLKLALGKGLGLLVMVILELSSEV